MPAQAVRPCTHPGCATLTTKGKCAEHRRLAQEQQDQHRGSAYERGYTKRWQRYAHHFRQQHQLCRHCEEKGITAASTCVDHIVPCAPDSPGFWNPSNHQALCDSCHSLKTVTHDGGFGNRRTNTDAAALTTRRVPGIA